MDNETVPITVQRAVAHECEYRAREVRLALREWNATSDPIKKAILEDCAKTLEQAQQALAPPPAEGEAT